MYVIGPRLIRKKWLSIYVVIALVYFTLLSEILPAYGFPRSFTTFHIGIHNSFLLRAFPFIIMGLILRENSNYILSFKGYSKQQNVISIVMFAGVSIAERVVFVDSQFYVGSYVMVVLILIYCIRNTECFSSRLKYIGKKLSLYVYVIQYSIIEILDFLSTRIIPEQFLTAFNWIKPGLCIVLTLGISVAVTKISDKGIRSKRY